MVYDRTIQGKELSFEASGALMDASLIMRDRETDSWWSIMTSDAIGGDLDGVELIELPVGEKAQWKDWVRRHPETVVLSVEGVEHDDRNPYAGYFESDRTFRDTKAGDDRLAAKEPIFGFWLDGAPHAAAFSSFEGGRVFTLDSLGADHRLVLYREKGSAIFASTAAYVVGAAALSEAKPDAALVERMAAGAVEGAEAVSGFDTFWYNWSAVNGDTVLVE